MAYSNWPQQNQYNQRHAPNNAYGVPGLYGNGPSPAPPAPYQYQNPPYQQWGHQPANQGHGAPNAPYQYNAPPPAPPPQSQQVPSYMNYNPGVYGGLAGGGAPIGQQPPSLPPRTQQAHGSTLAPAPLKPSITGSVRYNLRPDPARWQQTAGHDQQASGGYNSGPWPAYSESPQSSPMQHNVAPVSKPVSAPFSPDSIQRPPSLPPRRPVGSPPPVGPAGQYGTPHSRPTTGHQAANAPPAQAGGWFNPSGSIFPQFPPGGPQTSTPPMPPRPTQHQGAQVEGGASRPPPPYSVQSGPVSPVEHRDSLNSLYEPPPSRTNSASRFNSASSKDTSYHISLPGDLKTPTQPVATQLSEKPSVFALGASAEWEHFGDGLDDVDDTALYSRKAETTKPEISMPELDSTEVKAQTPKQESPAPAPLVEQPALPLVQDEPLTPAPAPAPVVAQEMPPVRTESPEPLSDTTEQKNHDLLSGDEANGSLDSHLRKLTMEEAHFSSVNAKSMAQSTAQAASQPVDIAPGLDVWYKSSLLRYIAMLYREAGAHEVEEKHKIFNDFMRDEAKVRGLESPLKPDSLQPPTQQWSEIFSPSEVVIPGAEQIKGTPEDNDASKTTFGVPPTSPDEDDTQYSPGGRPIISRPSTSGQDAQPAALPYPLFEGEQPSAKGHKPSVSISSIYSQPEVLSTVSPTSKAAEQPVEDKTQASSSDHLPQPQPQPQPLSTRPTYEPFRDRGNSNASLSNQVPTSPAPMIPQTAATEAGFKPYVPFSAGIQPLGAVLQQASTTPNAATPQSIPPLDSSSTATTAQPMSDPSPESPDAARPLPLFQTAPDGAPARKPSPLKRGQPTSIKRQSSIPISAQLPAAPSISIEPPSTSAHIRQPSATSVAVQQLDSLVLQGNQETVLNPRLENLRTSLLLYPSDYSFVNTAFDKWKTKAASNRARNEGEARNRHNDSQQHIDQLYNENQIAYQDIALLEDSFQKQEAEVKRHENESEYESYITEVFDPLYKRLQEEIGAVSELLMEAHHMVKEDGVAGKALLDLQGSDKVDLSDGLGLVVDLHQKLEERHDELAECIVKRDRRRQAIDEVATEGADKLTQMEFRKRLDSIERQASVTRCEEKKARVQPLWQLCRGSAMRGVRENKAYATEILAAVEAAGNDLVGADQSLLKVRTLRTFEELSKRSQALESSFYNLDTELNLVEYNAAMAHATLDKAPRSVGAKLTEEKDAEDVRLKTEHEERLRGIQSSLQIGQDAVEKVSRGLLGTTERALQAQKELGSLRRRSGNFRNALSATSPI